MTVASGTASQQRLSRLRWLLLALFYAVSAAGVFAQPVASRLVWNILISLLSIFFVVVWYHYWRRNCPRYFFARILVLLGIQHERRAEVARQLRAATLLGAVVEDK
jgi:hypothetical protein